MGINPIALTAGLSLPVLGAQAPGPTPAIEDAQDTFQIGPLPPVETETPEPTPAAEFPPVERAMRVIAIDEMSLKPYVDDLGSEDRYKAYQARTRLWNQFNFRPSEVCGLLLQAINHDPRLQAKVNAAILVGERGEDAGGKVLEIYFRESKDPAIVVATANGLLASDHWLELQNSFFAKEEKLVLHTDEIFKVLSTYLAPEQDADLRKFAAQGIFGYEGIANYHPDTVSLEFAMNYLIDPNPGVREQAAYCVSTKRKSAVEAIFPMLDVPHTLDAISGAVMVLGNFATQIPSLRGREGFGYGDWPLTTAAQAIAKLSQFQDPAMGKIYEDAQWALGIFAQADFPTAFILEKLDAANPLAVRMWAASAAAYRARFIQQFEGSRRDTIADILKTNPEERSEWENDALVYYPQEDKDLVTIMDGLRAVQSAQNAAEPDLRALATRAIAYVENKERSEWVEDGWSFLFNANETMGPPSP